MTYLTHQSDYPSRYGAGWGSPGGLQDSSRWSQDHRKAMPSGRHPEGVPDFLWITIVQDLAPLQGANWTKPLPEVSAPLRPPATFWATLRVANE